MHSRFGYSAVSTFEQCPYRYWLRHVEGAEVLPDFEPDNALTVGSAFHLGMEKGPEAAAEWYRAQFPVVGDAHETELLKLEYAIRDVRPMLHPRALHETFVRDGEFMGTIDYLEPVEGEPGTFDMLDFKYCNPKNVERYRQSAQLHLYKRHYERTTGRRIKHMGFLCVPKVGIKQGRGEELEAYRERVRRELRASEPVLVEVEYDPAKVEAFDRSVERIKRETEWRKEPSPLCRWCEYQKLCQEGVDYMILPSSNRRDVEQVKRRKLWIYGTSYSGKTTFLDAAPNPLNLNTDGNVEFVTMPYVPIKDEVKVEGRMTKRKFAWEVFKEAIAELEKGDNDFQTVIVDLVEDTRDMCRVYMYDKLGIQHESDASYGKGWDIIKTEYLGVMRRFFNLDYENLVVVSHETVSEVKKKSGQSITKIQPNMQEAVALKLAGMVDLTARVVVDEDGTRTLNFKANEYVFGGGRVKTDVQSIPLDWEELCKVYDAAKRAQRKAPQKATESPVTADKPEPAQEVEAEVIEAPEPPKRERKRPEPAAVEEPAAEQPVRRTRKRREA